MINVRALYPIYCSDTGASHTSLSVCEAMRVRGVDVKLTVFTADPALQREFVEPAVPYWLRRISCRKSMHRVSHWCTEHRYLWSMQPGEVAYMWPAVSLPIYEQLKAAGHRIVMERINCHRQTACRILDDAYRHLGWQPVHHIRAEDIRCETSKLALADYVFCPSPMVRDSMADAGADPAKLLMTSYGWDPQRFMGMHRSLPPVDGTTFVFVGLGCVRKGLPLLLQAWRYARLRGRLVIAGDIAPDVAEHCADDLNRPDVVHVKKCHDVAAIYRSADAFVLPTLEEGSPLVSYEAMACGLPLIVSPMAAGAVVRHGQEGLILDPYFEEAWIAAFHRIANDREFREHLGQIGRLTASDYTWQKVGARRSAQLKAVLNPQSSAVVAA